MEPVNAGKYTAYVYRGGNLESAVRNSFTPINEV
jgi:hypothetical protein